MTGSREESAPSGPLAGREVSLTGRFASMKRDEAEDLLRRAGARPVRQPGEKTDLVVVGSDGWPLREDGRPTKALERARELQKSGQAIEIVTEEELLADLGLDDRKEAIHRLCTAAELARLLSVPLPQIRALSRAGLIQPSKTVHRLEFFEFRQVAAAKDLVALVSSGVSVDRIRHGFERVRSWLPAGGSALAGRALIDESDDLLVRLEGGELAEVTGQLRFDFGEGDAGEKEATKAATPVEVEAPEVAPETPRPTGTPQEWFTRGQRAEELGRLAEARAAYRNAIELGAEFPEVHFNLGNVLYLLEHPAESAAEFLRAIERDPEYLEAWNNLGNTLAELGEVENAIRAYSRALELAPEYLDAHYNLAETLWGEGRTDEARAHYWIYLRRDPISPWADQIKARLASATDRS